MCLRHDTAETTLFEAALGGRTSGARMTLSRQLFEEEKAASKVKSGRGQGNAPAAVSGGAAVAKAVLLAKGAGDKPKCEGNRILGDDLAVFGKAAGKDKESRDVAFLLK